MKRFRQWNTLRNQMLSVYLLAMIVVLLFVSFLIFNQVSQALKDNARQQIESTAVEASARYDALIEQINLVTKQISTNEMVQSTLLNESRGIRTRFELRQTLSSVVNRIQANADGFYRVDIYTPDFRNLIPLDGPNLNLQVDRQTIEQVNLARGQLRFIGQDPLDSNYFLFMRRISLLDANFDNGGYLLIRMMRQYFRPVAQGDNQLTIVTDPLGQVIASNSGEETGSEVTEDILNGNEEANYLITEITSADTGLKVTLLTPIEQLTDGLTFLKTIIWIAGTIGGIIFMVFSYALSTYITKPILRLTEAMKKTHVGTLSISPESVTSIEINELNSTYNQLVKETNYLIQMVYEKELIKSRIELKALQAQINPHFLFNTLNALYWSLDEHEEFELAEMVLSMSDLFRYTISQHDQNDIVTLHEELNHLKDYINIMNMRFDNRLTLVINVPDTLYKMNIPKLIVQPLVENAVLHGLSASEINGEIKISARDLGNDLELTIEDDGKGIPRERLQQLNEKIAFQTVQKDSSSEEKNTGMALYNINKRLELYAEERGKKRLEIQSELQLGTKIRLSIPKK